MRRKTIPILLLIQQAVWLLVILPGHRRGMVVLPGFAADCCAATAAPVRPNGSAHAARACCPSETSAAAGGSDRRPEEPPADPARRLTHCAICFDAVRLVVAPPPDLVPTAAGLVGRLRPPAAVAAPSLSLRLPYDPTGPPARGC